MAFVFRYQKILDYRLEKEEQAKNRLAFWVSKHNHFMNQMESLKKNQKSLEAQFFGVKNSISMGEQMKDIYQHQRALQQSLAEIQQPLEEARVYYTACKRDRKVFEILKDKAHREFVYAEKKKEQKILDEYAQNNYIRLYQEDRIK